MLILLSGCISAEKIQQGHFNVVSGQKKQIVRIYDYPYNDVYNAILNTLEKRLQLIVSRNYTTEDTIFSSAFKTGGDFSRHYKDAYVYLFKLKSIDDNHTEVTLKAKGDMYSISDTDMLNKYIPEELTYYKKF